MIWKFEPSVRDLVLLDLDRSAIVRRATRNALVATAVSVCTLVVFGGLLGTDFVVPSLTVGIPAPMAAWVLTMRQVRTRARRHRADMDIAVAAFLDLVNVLVAGGAGIETAMLAAANAGDGWCFQKIRLTLAMAQSSRSSYWDALRSYGVVTGVVSLEDLANSVQLAGEQGARIRLTLASKARSLRSANLARIEHDAEQRTELMGLPTVVMFLGFVILIGYPAFVSTIGSL